MEQPNFDFPCVIFIVDYVEVTDTSRTEFEAHAVKVNDIFELQEAMENEPMSAAFIYNQKIYRKKIVFYKAGSANDINN